MGFISSLRRLDLENHHPESEHELGVTRRELAHGQKIFGRYTLKKILGRGGMGIVWLAHDEELEREVALKFLRDLIALDKTVVDESAGDATESGADAQEHRAHLRLPSQRDCCLRLDGVIRRRHPLESAGQEGEVFQPDELTGWTSQLCDVLDYAHNHARIMHRDLKPANLMVNQRGDLKVTDFGIARSLGDSMRTLTGSGGPTGTLVYMNPQQLAGERGSHLDDIYSLGATLSICSRASRPFIPATSTDKSTSGSPPQ